MKNRVSCSLYAVCVLFIGASEAGIIGLYGSCILLVNIERVRDFKFNTLSLHTFLQQQYILLICGINTLTRDLFTSSTMIHQLTNNEETAHDRINQSSQSTRVLLRPTEFDYKVICSFLFDESAPPEIRNISSNHLCKFDIKIISSSCIFFFPLCFFMIRF